MDLFTAVKVMLRHWIVVLVVLLATAPIARSIGDAVDPVYEATGTLLLLSPAKTYSSDGKIVEVNPFTRSGNAERIAAGAALTVTHTPRWKDRMTNAGGTGKYEYRLVSEVVMEVTITDATSEQAINTLAVADRACSRTSWRSASSEPERLERPGFYVDILAVPDTATVLLGSRIRATAGVGVLGVAVAATLAFLAEAIGIGGGRRRRRRRAEAAGAPCIGAAGGGCLAGGGGGARGAGGGRVRRRFGAAGKRTPCDLVLCGHGHRCPMGRRTPHRSAGALRGRSALAARQWRPLRGRRPSAVVVAVRATAADDGEAPGRSSAIVLDRHAGGRPGRRDHRRPCLISRRLWRFSPIAHRSRRVSVVVGVLVVAGVAIVSASLGHERTTRAAAAALVLLVIAALALKTKHDGTTLLIISAAVLVAVPSNLIFSPFGGAGTPAALIALLAGWLWAAGSFIPSLKTAHGMQPVRYAALAYMAAVIASYVAASIRGLHPMGGEGCRPRRHPRRDRHCVHRRGRRCRPNPSPAQCPGPSARHRRRVLGLIGILQFTFSFDVTKFIRVPGLVVEDSKYEAITSRSEFNRVAGTTFHPIEFSAVLTMLLPLALHLTFASPPARSPALVGRDRHHGRSHPDVCVVDRHGRARGRRPHPVPHLDGRQTTAGHMGRPRIRHWHEGAGSGTPGHDQGAVLQLRRRPERHRPEDRLRLRGVLHQRAAVVRSGIRHLPTESVRLPRQPVPSEPGGDRCRRPPRDSSASSP